VLEKLIHPMSKEEFLQKHWARHPLVIASPPGARLKLFGGPELKISLSGTLSSS
jgi:hypothetical protein